MKLIIGLGVICGAIWFLFFKGSPEDDGPGAGLGAIGAVVSSSAPSSTPKKPPTVRASHRFMQRAIPKQFLGERAQFGSVSVMGDESSNTVHLVGPAVAVAQLTAAIEGMDLVPGQCRAKAWIIFTSENKTRGFDLAAAWGDIVSGNNFASLNGGVALAQVSIGQLGLRFEALQSSGLVEVLQAPELLIQSGQRSRIETGTEVALPVSTINNNVIQTTIEFKPVGLSLDVKPVFLGFEQVDLEILQRNDVVGDSVTIEGTEVPQITTQRLESRMRQKIGTAQLLGGVQTIVRRNSKGFLSTKTEYERGRLWVVLALYQTEARATVIPEVETIEEAFQEVLNLPGNPLLPPKPTDGNGQGQNKRADLPCFPGVPDLPSATK